MIQKELQHRKNVFKGDRNVQNFLDDGKVNLTSATPGKVFYHPSPQACTSFSDTGNVVDITEDNKVFKNFPREVDKKVQDVFKEVCRNVENDLKDYLEEIKIEEVSEATSKDVEQVKKQIGNIRGVSK